MFQLTVFTEPWLWLGVALLMLIAEIVTGGLYLIPFSVGAGAASFVAFTTDQGMGVQVLVFCLITIVMFFAMRPLAERLTQGSDAKFNVDRLIGMTALVTETIDPRQASGRVRVRSEVWRAESLNRSVIPAGDSVVIHEVEGVRLIVKPDSSAEPST